MTQIAQHPVAFSAAGSTARPQESRYDNDARVARHDDDWYTVHAPDATYEVRRNVTAGWGIYIDDGVDLLPVAGGGHATGIRTHDQAIGALLGDPHA